MSLYILKYQTYPIILQLYGSILQLGPEYSDLIDHEHPPDLFLHSI